MSDLNVTTLMGRLTRNPELRSGKSGARFAVFTVAVNRKWKDEGTQREEAAFVPCLAFGPPAEWVAAGKKGESVMVSGRLRTESWEFDGTNHSRLVLVVSELQVVRLVFGAYSPQTDVSADALVPAQQEIPF